MKPIHKTDLRIYRTAYGLSGLAVGLPVLAVGVYYFLIGAGIAPLPGNPSGLHAPLWILGAAGLAFALASGTVAFNALRGIGHRRRAEAMRKLHPDQPWMADHPWNPTGIADESVRRPGYAFLAVLLLGVFLVPFNWWAFVSGGSETMVKVVVIIFDLVWSLVLINWLYQLAQWAKYRGSRLIFAAFPFAPGERLRVAFVPNRFSRMQATLRFVEERFEDEGSGDHRTISHHANEHYSESRTIDVDDRDWRVLIEFDIPSKPEWITQLTADPAIRYWELELKSKTPGIDFETAFPLPVYPNPRGSRFENPLFETTISPRQGLAAYRFELALFLFIGGALIAPFLHNPSMSSQTAAWMQSQWRQVLFRRALSPVGDVVGSSVMDVVLDGDGSVWVLTKYELSRFDSVETNYKRTLLFDPGRHQKELRGEVVSLSALLARGASDVLVGDWEGGLLSYGNDKWQAAFEEKSPIHRRIYTLLDHDGQVYIGAANGLWIWEGNRESIPQRVPALPRHETQVLVHNEGRLLAGIRNEIWRLEGDAWSLHLALPLDFGNITVIRSQSAGGLLIGGDGGLARVDGSGRLLVRELQGEQISTLFESGGRLWVGLWKDGIATREGDRWVNINMKSGLPGKSLSNFVVDRAGYFWLGYYDAGVARVGVADILKAMAPRH